MEERAIMQHTKSLLPGRGFAEENLIAPHQALVAYFSRVPVQPAAIERVALEDAAGRVLAAAVDADADYPAVARSAMDGFALDASCAPGTLRLGAGVRMGEAPGADCGAGYAIPIPTGGALPAGTDAVVPIEQVRVAEGSVHVAAAVASGENVIRAGDDMRRGERVLERGRRLGSPQIGLLAALGHTHAQVYRQPLIAVLSSGDELVPVAQQPRGAEVRDSNRYAVAASLRAMGARVRHYPTLPDEAAAFERGLREALECDAVVVTGGSSVGERDRLPGAVAALGEPGVVVHGLRVRPGKPALFGAVGSKPIVGLPGNPTSALMVLEAVAAPIVAALAGTPLYAPTLQATLAAELRSRPGWTWYVPVALRDEGGRLLAHPLALRSFSVSLTARSDGYVIMEERDESWPAGATVTVARFFRS
jgi:molybdopterin molybdotransferase